MFSQNDCVFLLIFTNGILAQTTQTNLNQVELMKQLIGTWQATVGQDTINIWEAKPFGKALIITNYNVIKGIASKPNINSIGYDDRDDMLKGFIIDYNAEFLTWIGRFTADKILKVDAVDTFKPEIVWWKNELEFITPTDMIFRGFDAAGVKTVEWNYIQVK